MSYASVQRERARSRGPSLRAMRPALAAEVERVGARKRPLLAADGQHGLALDDAGMVLEPVGPGELRRDHVRGEALDHDVAAGPAVERVGTRTADQDVIARRAEQDVGTG